MNTKYLTMSAVCFHPVVGIIPCFLVGWWNGGWVIISGSTTVVWALTMSQTWHLPCLFAIDVNIFVKLVRVELNIQTCLDIGMGMSPHWNRKSNQIAITLNKLSSLQAIKSAVLSKVKTTGSVPLCYNLFIWKASRWRQYLSNDIALEMFNRWREFSIVIIPIFDYNKGHTDHRQPWNARASTVTVINKFKFRIYTRSSCEGGSKSLSGDKIWIKLISPCG